MKLPNTIETLKKIEQIDLLRKVAITMVEMRDRKIRGHMVDETTEAFERYKKIKEREIKILEMKCNMLQKENERLKMELNADKGYFTDEERFQLFEKKFKKYNTKGGRRK